MFIATWNDANQADTVETGADRIKKDIVWLADPRARAAASARRASGLRRVHRRAHEGARLHPEGDKSTFRQAFAVTTSLNRREDATAFEVAGKALKRDDYAVQGYSPLKASVSGDLVFTESTASRPKEKPARDDYAEARREEDRRRSPPCRTTKDFNTPEMQRRFGDIRRKAFWAREGRGALVVVDEPRRRGQKSKRTGRRRDEARLPDLSRRSYCARLP